MSTSVSVPAPDLVSGFNDSTMGLMGIAIMLVAAVLWSAHGPNLEKTDFALSYVGAEIVHRGQGRHLYELALQKQLRDSLFQHPSPLLFEHPPVEAVLISPLAALSFRSAYIVWGLFNAALWLALIVFLRTYLPWPRENLAYMALWLLFAPLGVTLYQGQSSLILFAAYAIAFVSLKHKRGFAAGIALGLGVVKFQFVLPFAFIMLLRRKWRFLLGFVSFSLLLLVVSLIAVGWQGLEDYARLLASVGNNPQNLSYGSAADMPTIYGFVHVVLGTRMGIAQLNVMVALLSLLLLGWLAFGWDSGREGASFDLMFAAAVAASLVTGIHMFTHDLSPLLLPLFLVAGKVSNLGLPPETATGVRLAIASTLLLFWSFPVYFLFVAWHCMYLMCPVLLLFSWLALRSARYIGVKRQPRAPALVPQ